MSRLKMWVAVGAALALAAGCTDGPEGLGPAAAADTTVKMDFEHRPLPEIPLPNDLATRFDATSPTKRRVNASLVAPTTFEAVVRANIDLLDGWGVYAPITVPFSGLIDLKGVMAAHANDNFKMEDDVVYVIDISPSSPQFGKAAVLDIGAGNFPVTLKDRNGYWENDARGDTLSLLFEEVDEDLNKNGKLDDGEDTDLDGILDKPNYLPDLTPTATDLAGRSNALLSWYERETNTLIIRPLVPLQPKTTYAVVVTRRLKDAAGKPVGSPFVTINHTGQTDALLPLKDVLAGNPADLGGLKLEDIAFTWSFTTGSMIDELRAVRDGLYGTGPQAHLAAEFPPDLAAVHPVWNAAGGDSGHSNLYTVPGEKMVEILKMIAQLGIGFDFPAGVYSDRAFSGLQYVDYHVFGSIDSPQLFPRKDSSGAYLNYGQMVWPPDLTQTAAPARSERASFWLSVPRKESSPRKDGKPAGLVIIGHGYTGNKLTTVQFAGYFARYGIATLCLENVSHGFDSLYGKDLEDVQPLLEGLELTGVVSALFQNRSWDQDLDGREDSGADFWTAYTFHTRDVLRQSTLDYMQLVRVLRAFDGQRKWAFDTNNNGKTDDDVAGDFDGDGKVDIGGADTQIGITGSSLGGMMSALVGGVEPQVSGAIPVCAGGGLADVGVRSLQGGVREAVILRVMGPLYATALQPDGSATINQVIPKLNNTGRVAVATMDAELVKNAGSVLAQNLDNGEYDCALVKNGLFRVGLPSDVTQVGAQRHKLSFFAGNAFQIGVRDEDKGKACTLKPGVTPLAVVDKFGMDVKYFYDSKPLAFKKGDPLAPLAEGLGLHRARPEMRRFLGLAQMVLDPADPTVLATVFQDGHVYGNGDKQNTHGVVITTIGDMNVPASTGAGIGRVLGKWEWWHTPRTEWEGRSALQVLVDTHMIEAVNVVNHYLTPAGAGVLWDVENLSDSAGLTADPYKMPFPLGNDGYWAPRLKTGAHKFLIGDDGHGGVSGAFFPYVRPDGKHDLDFPGEQIDRIVKLCKDATLANEAPCKQLAAGTPFDHGSLVLEGMIQFLATGGKVFPLEPCQNGLTCKQAVPGGLLPTAEVPCDRQCSSPSALTPWLKKCADCP